MNRGFGIILNRPGPAASSYAHTGPQYSESLIIRNLKYPSSSLKFTATVTEPESEPSQPTGTADVQVTLAVPAGEAAGRLESPTQARTTRAWIGPEGPGPRRRLIDRASLARHMTRKVAMFRSTISTWPTRRDGHLRFGRTFHDYSFHARQYIMFLTVMTTCMGPENFPLAR